MCRTSYKTKPIGFWIWLAFGEVPPLLKAWVERHGRLEATAVRLDPSMVRLVIDRILGLDDGCDTRSRLCSRCAGKIDPPLPLESIAHDRR